MPFKKINLILVILLPVQILLVNFLKPKTWWIENVYATQFYPHISKFLRFILGWIPFSFGDALAFFLIGVVLYNTYIFVKNKHKGFLHYISKILAIVSVLYFCFYCFWGLNYFREPLAKKLDLEQSEYTTEQLVNTAEHIIFKLNEIHKLI